MVSADQDEYEYTNRLTDTVRERVRLRPAHGRTERYHVGIELCIDPLTEEWCVVYSLDNSHGVHHAHRHHPDGTKDLDGRFAPDWMTADEALPLARKTVKAIHDRECARYRRELLAMDRQEI